MKSYLLSIALLLGALCSWGQSATDQAAVLQKIIDLPELQQYYPKNDDGSLKQIYITQYLTAFSEDVSVSKSGEKVMFLPPDQIRDKKAEAYFTFRNFGMDQNKTNTTFNFFYNYNYDSGQFKMLTINLEMHKSGDGWAVSTLNIGGDK